MNSRNGAGKKSTNRRAFLKRMADGAAAGVLGSLAAQATHAETATRAFTNDAAPKGKMKTLRDLADEAVLKREDIDWFLDPTKPRWANFDAELGYTLRNSVQKDGVDGAYTISRFGKKHNERVMINFADRPCRINTYGNSFTMCEQVSDGESWQEYLAAHLGEPIRNFGVGGYGVYQVYRRMLQTETTEISAPYVILNIWGPDDHYRSLDAWRYLRCFRWFKNYDIKYFFHANPWDHLSFDLNTGQIVEKKSLCPTPESLYRLCDKDYICETFKNDLALNMYLGCKTDTEANTALLKQLAEALGLKLDFSSIEKRAVTSRELYAECAYRATMWIFEKTRELLARKKQKFLLLLTYSMTDVVNTCNGLPRSDQKFIDALKGTGIRYVDAIAKHVEDYKQFRLTPSEYGKRYYIGHYKPIGNYFFAFAIKNDLVDWLDPKPPAYQQGGKTIRFEEYI